MRRDIADCLQVLVVNRYREEKPDCELTRADIENIWFTLYGMLCRGIPEEEVEAYCNSVQCVSLFIF